MYVTENYRKTEFGVLTTGTGGVGGIIIPPNADRLELNAVCQSDCTNVANFSYVLLFED